MHSDKKVVAIICSDNRLIHEDKITETLGEKACIIWWREPFSPQEQSSRRSAPFSRSKSLPEGSSKGSADHRTLPKCVEESTLVLKTRLRNGKISYDEVEKRSGEWTPPKEVEDSLFKEWQSAPNVELLIYEHRENEKTKLRVIVNDNRNIPTMIERFFNEIAATGSICLPFRRAPSPPPPD